MIALPAIAMCGILATISMVAAPILRKRWMQYFALGCAAMETGMVIFLTCVDGKNGF